MPFAPYVEGFRRRSWRRSSFQWLVTNCSPPAQVLDMELILPRKLKSKIPTDLLFGLLSVEIFMKGPWVPTLGSRSLKDRKPIWSWATLQWYHRFRRSFTKSFVRLKLARCHRAKDTNSKVKEEAWRNEEIKIHNDPDFGRTGWDKTYDKQSPFHVVLI